MFNGALSDVSELIIIESPNTTQSRTNTFDFPLHTYVCNYVDVDFKFQI